MTKLRLKTNLYNLAHAQSELQHQQTITEMGKMREKLESISVVNSALSTELKNEQDKVILWARG